MYKALSVKIRIVSFAFNAPTIFVPSCNLSVPAVFVEVGVNVFISSCTENRINISSCVDGVPIVVSVPKCIKCLVVGDIRVILDAVGLLLVEKLVVLLDALTVNLLPADGFQVNVSPLAIVATNTSPKLSKDQRPGSSVVWSAGKAVPQPLKSDASVTVAPFECAAAVVPEAPLDSPVKSLLDLPEYVIS